MGRGFGRGLRVAVITHSQCKGAAKKTPRGLRGSRQIKRKRFQRKHDEQLKLEESMGMGPAAKRSSEKPLAQQIAAIQFPHVINKRQKGLKQLRKQIIEGVKRIRQRYAAKKRKQAESRASRKTATEAFEAP